MAGDPETDAFEQGAAHSAGTVDVEPWPNEFLTDSRPNMRDEVVDSPPERMTRPSFKQDRVRRTVAAAKVMMVSVAANGPVEASAWALACVCFLLREIEWPLLCLAQLSMLVTNGDRGGLARGAATEDTEALLFLAPGVPAPQPLPPANGGNDDDSDSD